MIKLDGASAHAISERGKAHSSLVNMTLAWQEGVLAVLGARVDGTTALLEMLAGLVPVRGGVARVFDRPPVESRTRIAYVPLEPALPDSLRVDEIGLLDSRIRGAAPTTAESRLAPLGIEKLAARRVSSLSAGEARAVALALALTSGAKLLLIEEPLAGLDPSAPGRVIEALRARAAAGAAIVMTTSSVRDATSLADQLGVLVHGQFTHLPPSLAHVGPGGARLRVVVGAEAKTEVAKLVAALAEDPAIASIETAAFAARGLSQAAVAILVTGPDLLAVARAVGASAAKAGANVEAIESAVMPLEAIRARVVAPRPGMVPARPAPVPPPQAQGSPAPSAGSTPPASGEVPAPQSVPSSAPEAPPSASPSSPPGDGTEGPP